jgi:hypothetical protein
LCGNFSHIFHCMLGIWNGIYGIWKISIISTMLNVDTMRALNDFHSIKMNLCGNFTICILQKRHLQWRKSTLSKSNFQTHQAATTKRQRKSQRYIERAYAHARLIFQI